MSGRSPPPPRDRAGWEDESLRGRYKFHSLGKNMDCSLVLSNPFRSSRKSKGVVFAAVKAHTRDACTTVSLCTWHPCWALCDSANCMLSIRHSDVTAPSFPCHLNWGRISPHVHVIIKAPGECSGCN